MRTKIIFVSLVLVSIWLATLASTALAQDARQATLPESPVVARVYFADRVDLDRLAIELDVWQVNHAEGYLLALLSPAEYELLGQAGYRLEVDARRTAELNQPRQALLGQGTDTVPGLPCYRTVEETYADMQALAENYPSLATWVDFGDSWDKLTASGPVGYDIYALDLTNKIILGPKPVFLLMAEIHAREFATAETAARFAEYLVSNYGLDPDITWLLDYYHVYIVPMINPDGRKLAEAGEAWRKNTDTANGCSFPEYGIDLNRNFNFHWGEGNPNPCGVSYQGPSAGSEPETQAIQTFAYSLFPDQRGPGDTDPAPEDTTGVFIGLHSFGQLVIWPWGWTTASTPNATQLQTLGRKLAFFNHYTPHQSSQLHRATGNSDDWAYGTMGIAAISFELGTDFNQSCDSFTSTVYPENRAALMYALKSARHPYQDPLGPESLDVTATPACVQPGTPVLLEAVANDTRYSSDEPTQNIAAAHYTIDDPAWITGTLAYPMTIDDGSFDEEIEAVSATVDTTNLSPGRHTLFVESEDVDGNWGVPGAVFLTVGEAHAVSLSPSFSTQYGIPGQIVTYTLVVENLGTASDTFAVDLTSNWTAEAPVEIANLTGCSQVILTVTVEVPASALGGMSDVATVVVTSLGDPAQSATAQLMTQATGTPSHRVYLVIIRK